MVYNLGMNKTVAFHTLGCKVNQYETEAIREQFAGGGWRIVREDEPADVYVINTCTVTNLADRKSRQYIRKARSLNDKALIAVTGCYAETDREEVSAIDGVSLVVGTADKMMLFSEVEKMLGEQSRKIGGGLIYGMAGRTRSYIKIQEGCDRYCAYCIIPYARGSVRSRDENDIIAEAERLVSSGHREIVLTGINTALYGRENGVSGIRRLLERLDSVEGDFRVRLSSLEPNVVSKDDVEELLRSKRLCHHLHLSVQSGSDSVLKRMNRRYTRDDYIQIVDAIRRFDPHYGITADIIVGFPGESEEEFFDSLSLTERCGFAKVHVFRYSPRRGTLAAAMNDQIGPKDKNVRSKALIAASEKASREFRKSCIGDEQTVLFEKKQGGLLTGYAGNYIRVYAEGTGDILNGLTRVRLGSVYKDGMKGEIING